MVEEPELVVWPELVKLVVGPELVVWPELVELVVGPILPSVIHL